MKRIVLAALAAGLVAGPIPAAVAKPKPKPLPACPSVTDPAGDSGLAGQAALNDPAQDLTKVRFSTVNSAFTTEMTLKKYADRPMFGAGNRFQVTFTVEGKVVDVYWKMGPAREQEANVFYQQGVRVDGVFIHDAVTGSVKGDVVTIAVKLNMLKSAVGKKIEGARATDVVASAYTSFVATNEPWDDAEMPAGFVFAQACK